MFTTRTNSYQNAHARRQQLDKLQIQGKDPNIQPDRLLTDRSTYIAYLESQLERVTSACLTVQSFDQRIEDVAHAARSLEEKVLSTGRLLKCSQAFAEENEVAQKQAAAELTRRMQQLECAVQSGESRLSQWEAAHEDALQARLDALEQRMLSKMDRALAQFLEGQLGVGPSSVPLALPLLAAQVGQLQGSVELLLSGQPTPADLQRADACLQSIDGARGVFQQQMQGLKAEGTQLREALHDVQWAASQASGPNQAAAEELLGGLQRKVDRQVSKSMLTLSQAESELQRLAQQLRSCSTADTSEAAAVQQHQQSRDRIGHTDRIPARHRAESGHETQAAALQPVGAVRRSEVQRTAEGAEQGMQQQVQGVQACMQGLQDTFREVQASLQSLQASLHSHALQQEAHKKSGVASSPRRMATEDHALRRSASSLSPMKQKDTSQITKRQWLPGGSFKAKDTTSPTKPAAGKSKAEQGEVGGENMLGKAIKRRQRLQKLYAELQSLQN